VIAGIRDLDPHLRIHDFLGKGTITVSDMRVSTPSINAVPDEATIFIDRRITFGDTLESALAEVQAIIDAAQDAGRKTQDAGRRTQDAAPSHVLRAASIQLELLRYDVPSYTGFKLVVDKYFPAWALDESHPLVRAALAATELAFGQRAATGKWDFSTNGTYWAGIAGIPAIGFGPGDERHAHTVLDQVRLDDVVQATKFYAVLPGML
jgi:acetylornithine deacetylase/succinyl-diaminopimelate desuccinylase-like protein